MCGKGTTFDKIIVTLYMDSLPMNRLLFFATLLISLLAAPFGLRAQEPVKTRILFIYDGSNSMNGMWEKTSKHVIAKRLLIEALDSLRGTPDLEMALRVYGHQKNYTRGQECNDTKLEVPFGPDNENSIKQTLNTIRPKGTTPIALSLEKAAGDFPPCDNCRNIIILITDGIEECDGDPCAVSLALQRKGIILKPFVIGIGLDEKFKKTFNCVGNYFDVTSPEHFENVLNIVISQALNSTTLQVNLLDVYGEPTETNVPMVFVSPVYDNVEYSFVHTMNARGVPDTLYIDPSVSYRLEVFTIPKVVKDNVEITPGTHNIIAVDAPQGTLEIASLGRATNNQPYAIVRKSGTMKTLNAQRFGTSQKYLVGVYDLEILTLPRVYINEVKIEQSKTTRIELPPLGVLTINLGSPGVGAIYEVKEGRLEWVISLNDRQINQSFKLVPGQYRIIYRAGNSHNAKNTKWKDVTIRSNSSTSVRL